MRFVIEETAPLGPESTRVTLRVDGVKLGKVFEVQQFFDMIGGLIGPRGPRFDLQSLIGAATLAFVSTLKAEPKRAPDSETLVRDSMERLQPRNRDLVDPLPGLGGRVLDVEITHSGDAQPE